MKFVKAPCDSAAGARLLSVTFLEAMKLDETENYQISKETFFKIVRVKCFGVLPRIALHFEFNLDNLLQ